VQSIFLPRHIGIDQRQELGKGLIPIVNMSAQGTMEEWKIAEPWLDVHCSLGEGPYFEKGTNSLRFVDIKKKHVHTVSLDEGPASLQTIQLDVPVTVTADIEGIDPKQKILLGLKYGIGILDRTSGKYEYVTKFSSEKDDVRLRSNDGAADPHGRYWLGTMTDFGQGDFQPEGESWQSPHFLRYATGHIP
jgi:sugar lactone lactonase YvrE